MSFLSYFCLNLPFANYFSVLFVIPFLNYAAPGPHLLNVIAEDSLHSLKIVIITQILLIFVAFTTTIVLGRGIQKRKNDS